MHFVLVFRFSLHPGGCRTSAYGQLQSFCGTEPMGDGFFQNEASDFKVSP